MRRLFAKNQNLFKKRQFRLLQIESSIACNLRCVMCPWKQISKRAENHGIMLPAIWESIRPYLREAQSVDFTGGGEPLLQPQLVGWISEAHAAGCETGILTNGFLLNKKKAEQIIRAGVDWICVSIDGATEGIYEQIRIGSDFKRVCENLFNIGRLRSTKKPKTMINFVLMPMNFHQVEDMLRLAARLGIDQVNYKQCDVIRGEDGKGLGLFNTKETPEILRLKKRLSKARRLAKRLNVQTTFFPFTPEEQPVCDQDPRDSVFIRHDGKVAPCISLAIGGPTTFLGEDKTMPTVHYGALPDEDLMDLWEGDTCKFFRKRFEKRLQTHDNKILESFKSGSSNRLKIIQAAKSAMPEAPQGCGICHYLYNI